MPKTRCFSYAPYCDETTSLVNLAEDGGQVSIRLMAEWDQVVFERGLIRI